MFCPMCGATARFQDIRTDTQSITCRFCSAEFSAAELLNEDGRRDEEPERRKRKEIPLPRPDSVQVRDDGLELVITRKWAVMNGVGTLFFGVFWTGITSGIFLIPDMLREGAVAAPSWFGILFLTVGVFMIGGGLYNIVNSTTYRISRDKLTVEHHPLPWPGAVYPLEGVEQLFVKQHIRTTRSRNGTSTTITYSLNKVMGDGRLVTIQDNMQPDAALYIEQEIERVLGLENIPVRGEYGKGGWAA